MREIKFRAWDVNKKAMTAVAGIWLGDDGSALTITFEPAPKTQFHIGLVHGESGILMQYTGLKDKNGKEIYEGDIVIADDNGESFPEEYDEKADEFKPCGKYKVVWDCDYPAFDLRELNGERLGSEFNPFTGEAEFEVMGNIYENPEMLK